MCRCPTVIEWLISLSHDKNNKVDRQHIFVVFAEIFLSQMLFN